MNIDLLTAIPVALLLAACAGSAPTPDAPLPDGSVTETVAFTVKPNEVKLASHLDSHVSYPINRAELLATCAETSEFNAAEKKWVELNLEGDRFEDAAAAKWALGLPM